MFCKIFILVNFVRPHAPTLVLSKCLSAALGEFNEGEYMNIVKPPGKIFLYPCAGFDTHDSIEAFGSSFDTFIFVDINYRRKSFDVKIPSGWVELEFSVEYEGPWSEQGRTVTEGKRRFRDIKPAWRKSRYRHIDSGREIDVVFRRGFGQYALHELADGSLGMFLHRGDSAGEGGSGVIYLGNRRTSHEQISNLMHVVKKKLGYPALIVSDGSNTKIRELQRAGQGDESIIEFASHGLRWVRIGGMKRRSGDIRHSIVWCVHQLPF